MSAAGPDRPRSTTALLSLTLMAIGVVYGDIGTSPLYTIRECFNGSHAVAPTHDNVLGVLSLIIYALIVVISVKYIAVVMRADNHGEGGILALTALVPAGVAKSTKPVLIGLGIFGAALLYGDGMITPAITVLGAVEGLNVITPLFQPYIVPVAVTILVGIFFIQQYGTHRVGNLFGPIMVVWFIALAALGIRWIVRYPDVLWAVDPRHAVYFFQENGLHGVTVLGAVFLAVTGGEALYADMGHFGKRPIRLAWFSLALPALVLNYFGQGALLLINAEAASQPFFLLAPGWALAPMVVLATFAAIIASQALISGAFSLTRQAIQLGYCPRMDIEHTSSDEIGQVYVPQVNWALMVATIVIVIGFKTSSSLAAAYGIAVTMTMIITVLLLAKVALERWHWPFWAVFSGAAVFLAIDGLFFGANIVKIAQGGWLPILIGLVLFTVMTTWKTGRRILFERLTARAVPLDKFMQLVADQAPARVPGTSVFMTAQTAGAPPALVHNLRHNKVLHDRVVVLTILTTQVPHVPPAEQVEIRDLGAGVSNVLVSYGFMQNPDVPEALVLAKAKGLTVDEEDITFFLGRETILVSDHPGMAQWRESLFVLMSKNAVRATAFFRLPPERVVELGVQVEI
jgi:KUP system potassium uptake protein